jgi:hypothetical protein
MKHLVSRLFIVASMLIVPLFGGEDPSAVVKAQFDLIRPNLERAQAEFGRKVRAENDRLVAALKAAMARETRAGNLDGALALKEAMEKAQAGVYLADWLNPKAEDLLGDDGGSSAMLDAKACKLPLGGSVALDGRSLVLKGPGTGSVENAVAVLPRRLAPGGVVKGRIKVTGTFGGFIVAADADGQRFHSVYRETSGALSVYAHTGATRQRVGSAAGPLLPADQEVPFVLRRAADGAWELSLNGVAAALSVPKDFDGWGLCLYREASVALSLD